MFLAIYANASVETDIYQSVLDNMANMVPVYDTETYDILFANRATRECRRAQNVK